MLGAVAALYPRQRARGRHERRWAAFVGVRADPDRGAVGVGGGEKSLDERGDLPGLGLQAGRAARDSKAGVLSRCRSLRLRLGRNVRGVVFVPRREGVVERLEMGVVKAMHRPELVHCPGIMVGPRGEVALGPGM